MATPMPTFARLTAAILLAALGGGVAELTRVYFDEGTPLNWLVPLPIAVGAVVGWVFTGPKLSSQRGTPLAIGFTSSVALAVVSIFLFACEKMLTRAMRMSYDNVTEAVGGVFQSFGEYLQIVAQADVIVALFLGGPIVGYIVNWVARRTR